MAYEEHVRQSEPIVARCAVVTLSDTRTPDTDKSGRRLRELLEAEGHGVPFYRLIRDEANDLHALLTELLSRPDLDVVLTNGGTGISRRDRTIEIVLRHLEQPL